MEMNVIQPGLFNKRRPLKVGNPGKNGEPVYGAGFENIFEYG
jgi:hypothetical protein